jgi:hypothetical protein
MLVQMYGSCLFWKAGEAKVEDEDNEEGEGL